MAYIYMGLFEVVIVAMFILCILRLKYISKMQDECISLWGKYYSGDGDWYSILARNHKGEYLSFNLINVPITMIFGVLSIVGLIGLFGLK